VNDARFHAPLLMFVGHVRRHRHRQLVQKLVIIH